MTRRNDPIQRTVDEMAAAAAAPAIQEIMDRVKELLVEQAPEPRLAVSALANLLIDAIAFFAKGPRQRQELARFITEQMPERVRIRGEMYDNQEEDE